MEHNPNRPEETWELIATDQAKQWLQDLPVKQADRVARAVNRLEHVGPTLGRPLVDSISSARHRNMKELRIGASRRVLFAFDHEQRGVLLVAGDKRGKWNDWYRPNIREADKALDKHQRGSGRVAPWRITTRTAGERFEISSR